MMPHGAHTGVLVEYYVIDTPTPCRYNRQASKIEASETIKVLLKAKTHSVFLASLSLQSPMEQHAALDSAKAPA